MRKAASLSDIQHIDYNIVPSNVQYIARIFFAIFKHFFPNPRIASRILNRVHIPKALLF